MKEFNIGDLLSLKNGKGSIAKKAVESGDIPIHGSRGIEGYTDEGLYEEPVIVIARVGKYAGSVHMTNSKSWVTDNAIVVESIDDSKINKRFAFYLLKELDLNKYTGGSAQSLLTQTSIKSIDVKIPNVRTQKKIVNLLDSIDRKIELNLEIAELLEETARAIYESWFEAHEPYDIPDGQEYPEEFEKTTLGEKITLEYGSSLTKSERKNGQYPVFGSNGQVDTHTDYAVESPNVVVGRKGTIGTVNLVQNDFWPIDTTYYLEGVDESNMVYFKNLLESLNLDRLNEDAAVPGLNRNTAYQQRIVYPSENDLDRFGKRVNSIYSEIRVLKESNEQLEELRDYLLPQLLSGQIIINDNKDESSDSPDVKNEE